jgi:hypothetical protein
MTTRICSFYDISIYMGPEKAPPHFLVRYKNSDAKVAINNLALLEGSMSEYLSWLVLSWAKEHKDELRKNWDLCKQNLLPKKIKPLN